MMSEIRPEPAPQVSLPSSPSTVRVRAIDTTTRMVVDASAFVQPGIKNHEKLNFKTMCFLVEHDGSSGPEHVLFDCGSRKDFWNGSPQAQGMIGDHVPDVQVEHGVDEILAMGGFSLEDLKAIVWSHWHWDHIGDGSKFPSTTDIVVGPGFTDNFTPGWPTNPQGEILASDLEGHHLHEPDFPLQVGGFNAHDYFGDGSFYLLDVPGHALGHICGLARTTPDTFVLMGADCCHYAGMFRPSQHVPMPAEIPAEYLDAYYPRPCPCSAFAPPHPAPKDSGGVRPQTEPYYQVSRTPGSAYGDADVAQHSINKLQQLDAHPDIFICLAHDGILFDILPLFNDAPGCDINDWRSRCYKERSRWAFLNELPKGDKPGREPLVSGRKRGSKELAWEAGRGFFEAVDQPRM